MEELQQTEELKVETEEIKGLGENPDNLKEKQEDNPLKQKDEKPEEKVEEVVPENYDFKDVELPGGMVLDEELTAEFSEAAKEMNLSQAKADKFMSMGVKLTQKIQENFQSAVKEAQENQIKTYKTMLNTDPEIGGANLKHSLLDANEAYQTFVSDEAKQLLSDSGLNNHPAIVKVFMEIGRQLKNDSIKGGNCKGQTRTAKDWYPSMGE